MDINNLARAGRPLSLLVLRPCASPLSPAASSCTGQLLRDIPTGGRGAVAEKAAHAWASRRPIEEVAAAAAFRLRAGPYAQSICRRASSHWLPLVHRPILFYAAMLKTGTPLLAAASSARAYFFAPLCLSTKGHNSLLPPTSFRRKRRSAKAAWRPRSRWATTWSANRCEARCGSSPFQAGSRHVGRYCSG